MILFRTFSPTVVDMYLNHPTVRPTMQGGTERLDSAALVNNPDNIILAGEGGCIMFIAEGDGVYNGHIAIIEPQRGRAALALGRQALNQLFDLYDAHSCRAAAPLQLPAVRCFARRLGFTSLGVDPLGVDELFVMEASTWKNC